MNKKTYNELSEIQEIIDIGNDALNKTLKDLSNFTNNDIVIDNKVLNIYKKEFDFLKKRFIDNLKLSRKLSTEALKNKRFNKSRVLQNNKVMNNYNLNIRKLFPVASNGWVLDGIIIKNQFAGIKNLAGFTNEEGSVIDVLNSASSVALGAENPWLIMADRVEDYLGFRDNICAAYHPGVRQAFALQKLSDLYPNKKVKDLTVHSESSGTIVDSIAIESAVSYAEKLFNDKSTRRVLTIDGTWVGGYGTAREGTGFGANKQQIARTGKPIWIDRCLPSALPENKEHFIKVLNDKIQNKEIAGIYLEPDLAGDLGIISVDTDILLEAKKILLKHKLPIILDCVQQLARTGSYWGENVDKIFADYPYLILTTAKSSSNGLPFGFTIMPKIIADCSYPLSQITTHQMNGPLLRALVVAEMVKDPRFQRTVLKKGNNIAEISKEYEFEESNLGLRGKYLNRAVCVGDNEMVKLIQIALLIEDGVLVGALPNALRYQPMLFELSETNDKVAHIIFRRVREIQKGNISQEVQSAYDKMANSTTGLAR